MPESAEHIKFKFLISRLLDSRGCEVTQELPDPQNTPLGLRSYQYDVHAITPQGIRLVVEGDGKVGHSSDYAMWKGRFRDACSFKNSKVYTARLSVKDVVGSKKLPDGLILKEIEFQVEQKYGLKISL